MHLGSSLFYIALEIWKNLAHTMVYVWPKHHATKMCTHGWKLAEGEWISEGMSWLSLFYFDPCFFRWYSANKAESLNSLRLRCNFCLHSVEFIVNLPSMATQPLKQQVLHIFELIITTGLLGNVSNVEWMTWNGHIE